MASPRAAALPPENPGADSSGPPRWLRAIVSGLLGFHFLAIFSAITGYSGGKAQAPQVSAELNGLLRPYLQNLHLDMAHRYYSPNPGSETSLWIRVRFASGEVQWRQWADPREAVWTISHVRRVTLPTVASSLALGAGPQGEQTLTPHAVLALGSFLRFLAGQIAGEGLPGVAQFRVYAVTQTMLTPQQIRAGWSFQDLRLRQAIDLGGYSAQGVRLDGPHVRSLAIRELVERILAEDVLPAAGPQTPAQQPAAAAGLPLPWPLALLLERHPELLRAAPPELPQAVRGAVFADDDPATPLEPGLDYDPVWAPAP